MRNGPKQRCVVHAFRDKLARLVQLPFELFERMKLEHGEIAKSPWQRLVIGIGNAGGHGARASGFSGGHGVSDKKMGEAAS